MRENATVFVRGLTVEASIGVHRREHGRRQRLVIDVELAVELGPGRSIGDTVDYEAITAAARGLADGGHVALVETFARELAKALLALPRARRVKVRVEKPAALAPDAAGAGVEITMGEV